MTKAGKLYHPAVSNNGSGPYAGGLPRRSSAADAMALGGVVRLPSDGIDGRHNDFALPKMLNRG